MDLHLISTIANSEYVIALIRNYFALKCKVKFIFQIDELCIRSRRTNKVKCTMKENGMLTRHSYIDEQTCNISLFFLINCRRRAACKCKRQIFIQIHIKQIFGLCGFIFFRWLERKVCKRFVFIGMLVSLLLHQDLRIVSRRT